MKKAIIFDFNGTMFFDEDKHVISWRVFAKKEFGVDIKDEDFPLHIHGFSNKEILKFLSGREFSNEEVKEYATRKELYYQQICEEDKDTLHLVKGLEEFLFLLKEKGVRIAICTASMKPNVDWYIKTFNLHRFFLDDEIIYDDGTLRKGKPDPEIYLRALNKLGIEGKDAIVFEDALSGITSSYRAGVDTIFALEPEERFEKVMKMPGVKKAIPDYCGIEKDVLPMLGL